MTISSAEIRKRSASVHAVATLPRVSRPASSLTYRGYSLQELGRRHSFEEVAYLLWHGELPTRDQLLAQNRAERAQRALGQDVAAVLGRQPSSAHPMDALRKAISALGANRPAGDGGAPAALHSEALHSTALHAEALRLFAVLPSLVAFEQRRRRGLPLVAPRQDLGYAANFLYMTFGKLPEPQVVAAFERSLILYAGDGFGAPFSTSTTFLASALAARAGASRLSVLYSAVAAAAGALKASAQGTAMEAVMQMLNEGGESGNARSWAEEALATGRSIPGFCADATDGGDGRVPAMRTALGMVAALRDGQQLIETYEALAAAVHEATGRHPSLDLSTAPAYHLIGFDPQMFTLVLAATRLPGWTAQLAGQLTAGRITRPRASYHDRSAGHRAHGG